MSSLKALPSVSGQLQRIIGSQQLYGFILTITVAEKNHVFALTQRKENTSRKL